MTLLEILVVLMILLMITAAAIPMMAPALQNRRMREAARLTSGFFSGARARAIQTGKPVGVVVQRFEGKPWATTLAYVEVPPPYAGEVAGAACTVQDLAINTSGPPYSGALVDSVDQPANTTAFWFQVNVFGSFNRNLARMYDGIQLNYRDQAYMILGPDQDNDGVVDAPASGPVVLHVALLLPAGSATPTTPWPSPVQSAPVPYQIFRQPVRTSDTPMQLPEGIVIDLSASGMGLGGIQFNTANNVNAPLCPLDPVILFSPSGSVGYVSLPNLIRPTGPVFFLLGRRELMPDVAKSGFNENISDTRTVNATNAYLQNFWISIGYQTGLIAVTELARNGETFTDSNNNRVADMGEYTDTIPNSQFDSYDITVARTIAQSGQSVGGN